MKKLLAMLLATILTLTTFATAFAVGVAPVNGEYVPEEIPTEPLATPEPNAVKIADFDEDNFVENGELQDQGTVWVEWAGTMKSKWGCSTASMNYTNPTRSNIGVTFKVGIFDCDLVTYFGTTFRSEEETKVLALYGLNAMNNGMHISALKEFRGIGMPFEGIGEEDFANMEVRDIVEILVSKGFMGGMTTDEILALTEDDVASMSEIQKLDLAQLADYDYFASYQVIGEAGVINPGYALYHIDLYTLPGRITLPKGDYRAVYVLNGYDAEKNQLSKFFIHLPITLNVEEDLPEELQIEYGVSLADRI